eukprot:tig00000144_g9008.t1
MASRTNFIDLSGDGEDDEALARRLQADENGGEAAAGGPSAICNEDEALARQLQEEEEREERERQEREREELHSFLEREERERLERESGLTRCTLCHRDVQLNEMHWIEACPHRFCRTCLHGHITEHFQRRVYTGIKCPQHDCYKPIQVSDLRELLSDDEYQRFQDASLEHLVSSSDQYVKCPGPNCSAIIEKLGARGDRVAASVSLSFSEPRAGQGGSSSRADEAERDKALKRFRCQACSTEFCAECKAVPYHEGYTCTAYEEYLGARHCRYCQAPIPDPDAARSPSSKAPGSGRRRRRTENVVEVCGSQECREKQKQSCTAVLRCGHPCLGIAGEEEHLACLESGCGAARGISTGPAGANAADVAFPPPGGALVEAQAGPSSGPARAAQGGQTADDFCAVCYVDTLKQAPCIRLACGHVLHYSCARSRLASRWPGVRVTFAFWNCPLCNRGPMEHGALEELLGPLREMHAELVNKAVQRLEAEGMARDPALTDPASRFHNDRPAYALHRFSYYPCSLCKRPYFAGKANCEGAAQAEVELMVDEEKRKDLICGPCSSNPADNCPKHGRDYIEYKCKFCCSVAAWFCWGTTHFCDSCHKVAATIVRQPIETLPACTCPRGSRPHPPNGTAEFCAGCSLCRILGSF